MMRKPCAGKATNELLEEREESAAIEHVGELVDGNARRLARWNPSSDEGIDTIAGYDQTLSVVVPPIDA
jgi:hypothetical protein